MRVRERERAKQKRPGPLHHLCVSSFTHSLDFTHRRHPSFHVCVSMCIKIYIKYHICNRACRCRWMNAYIKIRLLNRCFELCIITKIPFSPSHSHSHFHSRPLCFSSLSSSECAIYRNVYTVLHSFQLSVFESFLINFVLISLTSSLSLYHPLYPCGRPDARGFVF